MDNDSIPDDCDDLLDNDSDGISNELDLCEGFDDTSDIDGDGTPDGCDAIEPESDNSSNNSEQSSGDGLGNSSNTSTPQGNNETKNQTVNMDNDDTDALTEMQKDSDGLEMSPKIISSFLLIVSGTLILFYVIASQFFGSKKNEDNMKSEVFFLEYGIQDSTAEFAHVSPMVELPSLEPPAPIEPPAQNEGLNPPPIPIEGLPQGWTMEQWTHYGQKWLDAQ